MPTDDHQPPAPASDASQAGIGEVRVQAKARQEEAEILRPPVRRWFWFVAVALVLLSVFLTPFYAAYGDLGGGAGGDIWGTSYLPVLPYLILGVLILGWNPLWQLAGLRSLVLRGKELILLLILFFSVAGLANAGFLRSLFTMEGLEKSRNKNESYKRLFQRYPRELSLPSIRMAEGGGEAEKPDPAALLILQGLKSRNEARPIKELLIPPEELPDKYIETWEDRDPGGKIRDFVAHTDDILRTALEADPRTPLGRTVAPALWIASILAATVVLILGLIAFTARQWTHHERLQHPLVQVPTGLIRPGVLRSRGFLVSVAVILFINIYNYLQEQGDNPLPAIPFGLNTPAAQMGDLYKLFGIDVAAGSRWLYSNFWGSIRVVPFAIGLAFLLALDLGFSLWGMFFIGAIICGWLYAAGIPVSFDKHGRLTQGGAALGMALIVLWMGRLHYWRLLRAAFLVGRNPDDRTGVWGLRMLLVGLVCLTGLLAWFGGDVGAALLGVLIFSAFFLVIARLIAETGLAYFQFQITGVISALGLPFLFPVEAMAMMTWLGSHLAQDTRKNVAGFVVQASAAGERAGLPRRRIFPLMLGLMSFTIAIAILTSLVALWVLPGSAGSNPDGTTGLPLAQTVGMAQHQINHPGSGFWELIGHESYQSSFVAVLVGFVLIFALYLLRRIWVRSPFNPLGLVVFACYPLMQVWASLLLGWFGKFLVLRYGGSQLYIRLKPIAIGLIFGDVFAQGLLVVFRTIGAYAGGG